MDVRTLETSADVRKVVGKAVTSTDRRLMTWRSEERRETDGWGGWAVETSVAAVEVGGGGGGRWGWEVGERERKKKSEVGRKKKKRGESMWGPHIFVCVFEDE